MLSKKILTKNRGVDRNHESDKCLGWLPVTQQKLSVEANSNKTDCVQRNLYKAGHAHNLVYHKGGLVYSFPKPPAPNNICV